MTVARPDRPHVPQERRRLPHVDPFALSTPVEGIHLIEKSELLDSVADDDDIEWILNPLFDIRPDCATPESPDESLAMIQFVGTPEFQEKLRVLCRDVINILSASEGSLHAKVEPMVLEINRAKWEVPRNRLPPRHHSTKK